MIDRPSSSLVVSRGMMERMRRAAALPALLLPFARECSRRAGTSRAHEQ
jgi:hypothetical protein